MADLNQRINQLPRAYSSLNVADIGVVRSSAAATAGSEWGALAQAANAVGEQAARQNLTERQFNAQLEAASAGVTRDGSGNLVLTTHDTRTVEGRIFAANALKDYEVQFRLDANQRGKQMYAQAAQTGDIVGFTNSWNNYTEATLGAVPPAVRGLAKQILANTGTEYLGNLNIAKLENDDNLAKQALSVSNTQLGHDLLALANIGQGDSDKANGLMTRYKDNLASLVARRAMNSDQAEVVLDNLVREMSVQTFMGTVRDAWNKSLAAKVSLPKIREDIEGMIERFVTNPELNATVEQRNQMRVAAMTYIENRTFTQNALNVELERKEVERVTAALNNYRIMEAEALRVGDTEQLSSIRAGIHREMQKAGKNTLRPVIEAMINMDAQIKRLEDIQKRGVIEAFTSSISLQIREAKLSGDVDKMAKVRTRLEDFLKEHGTPGNRQLIESLIAVDSFIVNLNKEVRQETIRKSEDAHKSWLLSIDGNAALRRFFLPSGDNSEHAENMRRALTGEPVDATTVKLFENIVKLHNEKTGEELTWSGLIGHDDANSIVEMLSKNIPGAIAAEKNKLAPLIHLALRSYNEENNTDLTIDDLKNKVMMAETPEQLVEFAADIIKKLKPHKDKVTKLYDAWQSVQNALGGLGPPTQDEADFFVQHNWVSGEFAFANQPGKNAADFYNQIRRLPKIEKEVFQLGVSALPAATFRALDLYNNLDFDLKALVPNQEFWDFMRVNLQGQSSQGTEAERTEAERKVREIADYFHRYKHGNNLQNEQTVIAAFRPGGAAPDIMFKTADVWLNERRGLIERFGAFTGVESLYTPTPPLDSGFINDVKERTKLIMTQSPTHIERAVEMATNQIIVQGNWGISTLSSVAKEVDGKFNKLPMWIKDSPEHGLSAHGFGGPNDMNRFFARIIDMSERFKGRASSWPSFGQEMTETNRVVVRPVYGRGVDHSKGYAFNMYVLDDNGSSEQVTHEGRSVFYASRAASMYAAFQMVNSKNMHDVVEEANNFHEKIHGKPMSREDRELWRGVARILAAGKTEAQSLALFASDEIRSMAPVRAWRYLDLTMRDINNRFLPETVARIFEVPVNRYGIKTDPDTKGRARDPNRSKPPGDFGVGGKTLPLPPQRDLIRLPEIDEPDGSVKPGGYVTPIDKTSEPSQ